MYPYESSPVFMSNLSMVHVEVVLVAEPENVFKVTAPFRNTQLFEDKTYAIDHLSKTSF